MNDLIRRPSEQQGYSPKSSPARGSRSPVVVQQRQDSTGTLKTTISLGKTPAIVHSGPFYLLKPEAPVESELTGSTHLIEYHNLQHSFNKFCFGKKLKESLSSFLPNLPGNIDIPATGPNDQSSLRSLIEKPPIGGKELLPLTPSQLTGFRLHPGPLPEQYRLLSANFTGGGGSSSSSSSRKKHKKDKKNRSSKPLPDSMPVTPLQDNDHHMDQSSLNSSVPSASGVIDKKHDRKRRKHDDEREKERKKKKKEKKKKKQRYSPDPSSSVGGTSLGLGPSSSGLPSASSGIMSDRSV